MPWRISSLTGKQLMTWLDPVDPEGFLHSLGEFYV